MSNTPHTLGEEFPGRLDEIHALVTHRPALESRDVVSLITGYALKPDADITVTISGTKANWAWRGLSIGGASAEGQHRLGRHGGSDKPVGLAWNIPWTGQWLRTVGAGLVAGRLNAPATAAVRRATAVKFPTRPLACPLPAGDGPSTIARHPAFAPVKASLRADLGSLVLEAMGLRDR